MRSARGGAGAVPGNAGTATSAAAARAWQQRYRADRCYRMKERPIGRSGCPGVRAASDCIWSGNSVAPARRFQGGVEVDGSVPSQPVPDRALLMTASQRRRNTVIALGDLVSKPIATLHLMKTFGVGWTISLISDLWCAASSSISRQRLPGGRRCFLGLDSAGAIWAAR